MGLNRSEWIALAIFAAATLAVYAGGGLSAANASEQYAELDQPSWAPPSWLFGPVWSVLYIMIAAAGFIGWRATGWNSMATKLWFVQIVMNGFWSPFFFAWELRGLALGWILMMDVLVLAYIILLWRPRRLASGLMIPYLAWILFASCLNGAVWWLNR